MYADSATGGNRDRGGKTDELFQHAGEYAAKEWIAPAGVLIGAALITIGLAIKVNKEAEDPAIKGAVWAIVIVFLAAMYFVHWPSALKLAKANCQELRTTSPNEYAKKGCGQLFPDQTLTTTIPLFTTTSSTP